MKKLLLTLGLVGAVIGLTYAKKCKCKCEDGICYCKAEKEDK